MAHDGGGAGAGRWGPTHLRPRFVQLSESCSSSPRTLPDSCQCTCSTSSLWAKLARSAKTQHRGTIAQAIATGVCVRALFANRTEDFGEFWCGSGQVEPETLFRLTKVGLLYATAALSVGFWLRSTTRLAASACEVLDDLSPARLETYGTALGLRSGDAFAKAALVTEPGQLPERPKQRLGWHAEQVFGRIVSCEEVNAHPNRVPSFLGRVNGIA